ncbi:MAG: sulfatase-like hydrolase/transferase [Spirochaetia bacterium]|nr:sulfatase-like hydrolase/transferase [Spirochaetia bacterium]
MAKKKNILFIMTDQHRLSAVGAYGETPCRTPHIDSIAEEGVLFRNAYTVCPVCSPARGSIMTGVYPHTHGISANLDEIGCSCHELMDSPSLLPRKLQESGYGTGYTGKWHLCNKDQSPFSPRIISGLPKNVGFEKGENFPGHGEAGEQYPEYLQWLLDKGYENKVLPWSESTKPIRNGFNILDIPTEYTVPGFLADSAIQMMSTFREEGRPFFISLDFWGPHNPYHVTQEFIDLYKDVTIPPWPNYEWPSREIPGPHHVKIHWEKEKYTWEDWETAVKYYYARTSMIDSQIGRLLDYMRSKGFLENTDIIFTADHGETLGSHGSLLDKGWNHFEEIQRIPFIIRFADGRHRGSERDEFISNVDIYPTVCDLAGADYDDSLIHGSSIIPLLENKDTSKTYWRDTVVTEFLGLGGLGTSMKTIRKGNIKYGCNISGFEDELYDLLEDPYEIDNKIHNPAYRKIAEDMKKELIRWMKRTDDQALRSFLWREGYNIENPHNFADET